MIKLYAISIDGFDFSEIKKLVDCLPAYQKNKILTFQNNKDKIRSLLGMILVIYHVRKNEKCKFSDLTFQTNEFGKPECNLHDFYFNISHSGNYVICACSTQQIGVDIEQMNPLDHKIAKHFFCSQEYKEISKAMNRTECFYKYWTAKESYVKYIGKGLLISLNSFCVSFDMENGRVNGIIGPVIYSKKIANDYMLSICTEVPELIKTIYITKQDVLKLI